MNKIEVWAAVAVVGAFGLALVMTDPAPARSSPAVVEPRNDPASAPSVPATRSAWDNPNDARRVIELCWEDQKRKSLDPATQRLVAGVCENLEAKFVAKLGHKP